MIILKNTKSYGEKKLTLEKTDNFIGHLLQSTQRKAVKTNDEYIRTSLTLRIACGCEVDQFDGDGMHIVYH